MKVEDLMSSSVHTCGPGDVLEKPAWLMWHHDVGLIPVVDAGNHLVGVLTDRDIAMAAMLNGGTLRDIDVAETMTREVETCAPGDEIQEAERRMAHRRVRRLPVVDGAKHVVGLLSLNDLASAVPMGREGGVSAAEVARTLQAVCQRRHPVPGAPE